MTIAVIKAHLLIVNKNSKTLDQFFLNLPELTDIITKLLDGGNNIYLLTADFSKALDKILHYKLLYKLSKFVISGCIHNRIKCFLKDRKFIVYKNSCNAVFCEVTSSVSHGSKLGPLLYILLITNDQVNACFLC